MNTLQLVTPNTPVEAGMTGDFDLCRDEFSLAMTTDGMKAAGATMGDEADQVLTLLKMPVLDGFHFLAWLAKHHLGLPVVVSHAPSAERGCRYLLEPEGACLWTQGEGSRQGVTLVQFLSFCLEERQTHVLELSASGGTAVLHVTFGRLVHARCEEKEGEPAFLELLGWKMPHLRVFPGRPGAHLSIHTETDVLLVQASSHS